MKRLFVKAYEVALIFRRGKLVDVLTEDVYWIKWSSEVVIAQITQPFLLNPKAQLWLENEKFLSLIDLVEIQEGEIGIEYRNGIFQRALAPGKIAYWKSSITYDVQKANLDLLFLEDELAKNVLLDPALTPFVRVIEVKANQNAILYVDGKFESLLGAGRYFLSKYNKSLHLDIVDLRIQDMAISGQEILTKDKASVRLNFNAQWRIVDAQKAYVESKESVQQLYTSIQFALREYIGGLTFDQLLANREEVGNFVVSSTLVTASLLGVEILSGGIKDIILPGDMKDIMNQVLVAQKRAQANSIMRHEETASTRSLLNTAKLMESNSMLLKLKEMEYMEKIADRVGDISINGDGSALNKLRDLLVSK